MSKPTEVELQPLNHSLNGPGDKETLIIKDPSDSDLDEQLLKPSFETDSEGDQEFLEELLHPEKKKLDESEEPTNESAEEELAYPSNEISPIVLLVDALRNASRQDWRIRLTLLSFGPRHFNKRVQIAVNFLGNECSVVQVPSSGVFPHGEKVFLKFQTEELKQPQIFFEVREAKTNLKGKVLESKSFDLHNAKVGIRDDKQVIVFNRVLRLTLKIRVILFSDLFKRYEVSRIFL
eukprot:TRINITY_DN2612_c0_g1_i4.p1 TRINITY_DN2612_c0_g1~~TRINITY_DN2612_c0_g1_i4.p1  ORF type:complete len:235 (-),score=42.11 TRINITY_DN2612_c0_g1_i4:28-732(-)